MKLRTLFNLTALATIMFLATDLLLASGNPVQAKTTTDKRIESTAKKSYVFKTYLKGDAIKINVNDGVATLAGTVAEESHKTMAEDLMTSLPGVTSVSNQLTVTNVSTSPSSDAWLAQRVRGTLLLHRSVSYPNTNVSVTNGIVTLKGKASSEAQKQLSSEYASDVMGVKSVDNQMTIEPKAVISDRTRGQEIDDASITTQVKMSLKYHHGTDGDETKVSTHKGVVTLLGTAKNQAEIDLATKRVGDVHGVKSVENKMTIEVVRSSNN